MRQDWVPIFWEPYFQGSCLIFYFNSLRLTFRTTSIKYRKQYVECVRYRLSLKLMHISLSGIFALAHFISGCLSLQLRKYPWSLSAKRNSKILGFKTDSHLPLCSRKDRARTQMTKKHPQSTQDFLLPKTFQMASALCWNAFLFCKKNKISK